MLIRFGLGGQLSGSVGGVVAGHNKGGQYLRNRSIPTNPNSTRQQQQRSGFGAAAIAWRGLTAEQREDWESYAAASPRMNRLGESITVSGFNQYIRTNAFLTGIGLAAINDAPITPGESSLGVPDISSFEANEATGLSFVTVGCTATKAGSCQISYSPSLSAGVKYFKGPYTLFALATLTATGVLNEIQEYTYYGPIQTGQRRAFRIRSMDAQGRVSNVFETIATIVS